MSISPLHSNYQLINLTGTMGPNELGNGVTASTVHEVYCTSNGSIDLTLLGGGSFTWTATTGESMSAVLSACTVNSGTFIGFKTKMPNPVPISRVTIGNYTGQTGNVSFFSQQ